MTTARESSNTSIASLEEDDATCFTDPWVESLLNEQFLEEKLGKEYVFSKNPDNSQEGLFSWQDLFETLNSHRIDSSRLRMLKGGELLPGESYLQIRTTLNGITYWRVDAQKLELCLTDGAVLNFLAVDETSSRLAKIAKFLMGRFGAIVTIGLYAATRPSHGLNLHQDTHDVLIFQLDGKKIWEISSPIAAITGDPPLKLLMEPGDTLYLPAGWWHEVRTVEGPAMHLTCGIFYRNVMHFFSWVSQREGLNKMLLRPEKGNESPESSIKMISDRITNLLTVENYTAYIEEQSKSIAEQLGTGLTQSTKPENSVSSALTYLFGSP